MLVSCVLLLNPSPVAWRMAEASRVVGAGAELDGGQPSLLLVFPGAVSLSWVPGAFI